MVHVETLCHASEDARAGMSTFFFLFKMDFLIAIPYFFLWIKPHPDLNPPIPVPSHHADI